MSHRIHSSIATAIVLALALLLAGVAPACAQGADVGNINVSVPTEIPMAVDSTGRVTTASGDAMAVRNNGSDGVRITNVAASSAFKDFKLHVKSGVSADAVTDAWFDFDGASVTQHGGKRELAAGASLFTEWSVDRLYSKLNRIILDAIGKGKTTLATVTYSFEYIEPQDFATFCADDGTLRLYRANDVPQAGDTYQDHVVTQVFTDINRQNPFYDVKDSVTKVEVDSDGIKPTTMNSWFASMANLTQVEGLARLDTSGVGDMSSLFAGCKKLQSLDLSGFDTSHVTDMGRMFQYCHSLVDLDLGSFDTSKVTSMSSMFEECLALNSVNLSSFDTSSVRYIGRMFRMTEALASLDLSSFTISSDVANKLAFSGSGVAAVTVGTGWKLKRFDGMPDTLYYRVGSDPVQSVANGKIEPITKGTRTYCTTGENPALAVDFAVYAGDETSSLRIYHRVDIPAAGSVYDGHTVTKLYTDIDDKVAPFEDIKDKVSYIRVYDDGVKPLTLERWFSGMANATYVDVGKLDTSAVKSMAGMFDGLGRAENIFLGSVDTSNVTDMSNLFRGCATLEWINVSKFDTSNVADFSGMFDGCSKLNEFIGGGVSGFNTSKATSMRMMFQGCSSLTEVDVSGFKTSRVTDLSDMFDGCTLLKAIDVSRFDTANVKDMSRMFRGCMSIKSIDLSSFSVTLGTRKDLLFGGLQKSTFKSVKLGKSWTVGSLNFGDGSDIEYLYYADSDGVKHAELNGMIKPSVDRTYYTNKEDSGLAVDVALVARDGSLILTHSSRDFEVGDTFLGYQIEQVVTGIHNKANAFDHIDKSKITRVIALEEIDGSKVGAVTSVSPRTMASWFSGMDRLMTVGFDNLLDTSQTTDMSNLFFGCSDMAGVNLSNFDTGRVTSMEGMFRGCSRLSSIKGLSGLDLSKVKTMDYMFGGCKQLSTIDFSKVDTSNITSVTHMFEGCSGLTSMDLSGMTVDDRCDTTGMFPASVNEDKFEKIAVGKGWGLTSFPSLDADLRFYYVKSDGKLTSDPVTPSQVEANFATTYYTHRDDVVVDFAVYFRNNNEAAADNRGSLFIYRDLLSNVPKAGAGYGKDGRRVRFLFLNIDSKPDPFDAPDASSGDFGYTKDLVCSITVASQGVCPSTMESWFSGFKNLGAIDGLDKLVTSHTTSMRNLCKDSGNSSVGGEGLVNVDMTKLRTGNVRDMSGMFQGFTARMTPDVSQFDTSSATNMSHMFDGIALNNRDLTFGSGWDTSHVTDMSSMFAQYGDVSTGWWDQRRVFELNASMFDTSSVTNMAGMFGHCNVKKLDLSAFNTSHVTDMSKMFFWCSSNAINLTGFDTSSVTDMSYMFCYTRTIMGDGLNPKDLLGYKDFDTSHVVNMESMFEMAFMPTAESAPLDLSRWNTSHVANMAKMFKNAGVYTVDVSNFDTSNVQDMSEMFNSNYFKDHDIDVSSFDTGKVTNDKDLFYKTVASVTLGEKWTKGLPGVAADPVYYKDSPDGTLIPISRGEIPAGVARTYYTSNASDRDFAVFFDDGLLELYRRDTYPEVGSSFDGDHKVVRVFKNMSSSSTPDPFADIKERVTSFKTDGVGLMPDDLFRPQTLESWFSGMVNLETADLTYLDTTHVTSASDMFKDCPQLEWIEIGPGWGLDTLYGFDADKEFYLYDYKGTFYKTVKNGSIPTEWGKKLFVYTDRRYTPDADAAESSDAEVGADVDVERGADAVAGGDAVTQSDESDTAVDVTSDASGDTEAMVTEGDAYTKADAGQAVVPEEKSEDSAVSDEAVVRF